VRWVAGGTAITELGNLGTDPTGVAGAGIRAANDNGTAVGLAEKYDSAGTTLGFRAVRWDAAGTAATELANLGTAADGSTYFNAGSNADLVVVEQDPLDATYCTVE
jgi:hypothetical protein